MSGPESFVPGRSIQGESGYWYKIHSTLGSGGNAVTFLVVCSEGPYKGVPFALKFFRRMSEPDRRKAFLNEARFLKTADHPAVMRIYDDGAFELGKQTSPFLVAEYLPRTLAEVMRNKSASFTEKVIYATQLVSALSYLSERDPKVIHRDVKPQNIFIKGRACVLGDFGLLKVVEHESDDDRQILKESVGVGMPHYYRSPDLVSYAKGDGPITTKSDVFQLGLVLTQLFTGRNPCVSPEKGDPFSPVRIEQIGQVPGNHGGLFVPLLREMLEMNPDDRPSAGDLLGRWLGAFERLAEISRDFHGETF